MMKWSYLLGYLMDAQQYSCIYHTPFKMKNTSTKCISRLNKYTNNKFNMKLIWQSRKIRSIFKLKDKVEHISDVIYKGTCNCIEKYYGVTGRIAETRT